MPDLFRREALEAQRTSGLGTIRIGRNPGFTKVTLAAMLLAAALIAYATLGTVTRRARLVGILVPTEGTIVLSAPQAGTLLDIAAREGESVRAGSPLARVGTDRSTSRGDAGVLLAKSMEQRRATLQAERSVAELQHRQRLQATADRGRGLGAEARQAGAELESAKRRIELARRSAERYAELARSGFVSEVQAQQKQDELLDLVGRAGSAERALMAIERDLQALKAERIASDSSLQAQQLQLDRSLAALEQEQTENGVRQQFVVTAPQNGVVTAVTTTRGQTVQAGQNLMVLVADTRDGRPSPLKAELFAPSRTAGFVQAGQTVWIRYGAYPFQRFGMAEGRVADVSRTPLAAQDLPPGQGQALMNAAMTTEPMYRVTVSLAKQSIATYGKAQPLKPGMTLEADVVQEERRIWEWILDPVIAATGLSASLPAASRAAIP